LNNWNGVSLTARYGELDGDYQPVLSALYPYAAVNAYDINWIDRPLFLDPNNVSQGWEADLRYAFGRDWLLRFRAYDGSNRVLGGDADFVWMLALRKQMARTVAASVLYGRREVRSAAGPDLFAGEDLQVLRGALEFSL
jgi:hypothetical protein